MSKKLGVIGGMGPEATCTLYHEIISHTKAASDQEHIDVVILGHASMPDRTRAILTGDETAVVEAMGRDAVFLEQYGVSNIAIPCNTAHYFYDKVQAQTKVPMIHMPRESVKTAMEIKPGLKKIGIMGTDGTIRAGVYAKECQALGIEAVAPSEEAQKAVMSLIYDDVKSGKAGEPWKFEKALADLRGQGCEIVILACTELSVFKNTYPVPEDCLDAMDVLIRECVLRSDAEYI